MLQLQVYEELVDEKKMIIISNHSAYFGLPACAQTADVWSLQSCRDSFGCMRASLLLDGDMPADVTGLMEYKGKLEDFSPMLSFERFTETRHTGTALPICH